MRNTIPLDSESAVQMVEMAFSSFPERTRKEDLPL
jgi:hypothetical protein